MVFAREINDGLISLIKKIDTATGENNSCRMGSFVVFLSDQEGMEQKLKDLAQKEDLKHTVLTLDNPAGPRGYHISKDADVTVVLYRNRTVKANYAFSKGQMTNGDVNKIAAAIPEKLVPEKK